MPPSNRTLLLAGLVYLLAIPCVAGPWPGGLSVRGNLRAGTEEILRAARGADCGADSACVEAVCRAVAEAYWSWGYLDAEIECQPDGADAGAIAITVTEGQPARLASVGIEGADPEDRPALAAILAADDPPLSQAVVETAVDRVLSYYDSRGRPVAVVVPEVRRTASGNLEMILRVEPGPRATLGPVVLLGLRRISPASVLPETGLHRGETYDGARVDGARGRLQRLGVFASVSEPRLSFAAQDTTVAVAFDVVEAATTTVEGAMAYSPNAEGATLVGSLAAEMLSIGGSLRRFRVHWRRSAGDRLAWGLNYREPRIAGRPLALEAGLASDVIDTSYARRRLALGLLYVGEPGLEAGVGVTVGSTRDRMVQGGEGDFSERGVTFRVRYDCRDRPVNPGSGLMLELADETEALRYGDRSLDRTLSAVEARAQYLVRITSRTRLVPGVLAAGVFTTSGEVPLSHLVRLGGAATLRGYPEDWFATRRVVAASVEVRRLLSEDSRVYAFLDAATLDRAGHTIGDLSRAPFGYGFGFLGRTAAGALRVEIALGRGDSWSRAKLHLALAERF